MSYRDHMSNSGEWRVSLILIVVVFLVFFWAISSDAEPDEGTQDWGTRGIREVRPSVFLLKGSF